MFADIPANYLAPIVGAIMSQIHAEEKYIRDQFANPGTIVAAISMKAEINQKSLRDQYMCIGHIIDDDFRGQQDTRIARAHLVWRKAVLDSTVECGRRTGLTVDIKFDNSGTTIAYIILRCKSSSVFNDGNGNGGNGNY
jgi:hypothetical protein